MRLGIGALLLALVACGGGGAGPSVAPPVALRAEITYVGLGASDAVGVGAVPFTNGYVYRIEGRLQERAEEVDLRNLGIAGARIETVVDWELPDAIAADPDLVTLWTGANDVVGGADPDAFALALDVLLGELGARTSALVFVADVPDLTQAPLFRVLPDPDVTAARIEAFNVRIAETVARHGYVLVPLSDEPLSDDLFFVDGFHPNNAGHEAIAARFWEEIAPRL